MKFDHGTGATMARPFTKRNERTNFDARNTGMKRHSTAPATSTTHRHSCQSSCDISNTKELRLQELAMLSIAPIVRSIHHWWLQRAERHYLICADVEEQRAREAQMNVAYYQKRAALARSARI